MKKYIQIKEKILSDINSGVLQPGERLPVREELIKKYKVTRATLNKALSGLISENWVTARRNAGTFVSNGPQNMRIAYVSSKNDLMITKTQDYDRRALDYIIVSQIKNNFTIIEVAEAQKNLDFIGDYDAVIWPLPSGKILTELKKFAHKTIIVNRYSDDMNYVSTNHRKATKDITEAFIKRFKSKISLLYLDLIENDFISRERRLGFMDACEKHHKFYHLLRMSKSFEENVNTLMDFTLSRENINVIISPSGSFTGPVLRMAYKRGLLIEKDFYYSDFDTIDSLFRTGIEIPSVLQDYRKMGLEVADAIKKLKDGPVRKFVPHYFAHMENS